MALWPCGRAVHLVMSKNAYRNRRVDGRVILYKLSLEGGWACTSLHCGIIVRQGEIKVRQSRAFLLRRAMDSLLGMDRSICIDSGEQKRDSGLQSHGPRITMDERNMPQCSSGKTSRMRVDEAQRGCSSLGSVSLKMLRLHGRGFWLGDIVSWQINNSHQGRHHIPGKGTLAGRSKPF